MHPGRFVPAVALAVVMAGCGQPASADRATGEASTEPAMQTQSSTAAAPAIAGVYRMRGARVGDLTLEQAEGGWKISLRGGVPTDMGAATPADCELQAQGPLVGDRIEGVVTPFEGETGGLTAEDLQGRAYVVTVRVDGQTASVATDYDGCGMGADLSGDYTRASGG